jgi:LmbE family N-acetylglucosaminyl deacetylase
MVTRHAEQPEAVKERLTVVAPHADDAALSLGGTLHRLARAGVAITVLTCHTRSAWAPQLTASDAETVTQRRRQEDARYARLLGARLVELDLAEAALRRPDLDVQRPLDDGDRGHGRALGRALGRDSARLMLVPLAIGDHVDHQLARTAAVASSARRRLCFYEDLPYALWSDWPHVRSKVRAAERLIGGPLLPLRLATTFIRARRSAIGCYPSQFSAHEQRAMEQAVQQRGGEILWAPQPLHRTLRQLAAPARQERATARDR